jgi:hypothetical protein
LELLWSIITKDGVVNMKAIFEVDGKQLDIKCEELPSSTIEQIEINTGESDEDFATRRNTLSRWVLGLPKKRKPGHKTYVAGRLQTKPITIIVNRNDNDIFENWAIDTSERLSLGKKDCVLITGDGTFRLFGVFVEYMEESELTSNVKLRFDYFNCKAN